jgi:hypothetical protein
MSIAEFHHGLVLMPNEDMLAFFRKIKLPDFDIKISERILTESVPASVHG